MLFMDLDTTSNIDWIFRSDSKGKYQKVNLTEFDHETGKQKCTLSVCTECEQPKSIHCKSEASQKSSSENSIETLILKILKQVFGTVSAENEAALFRRFTALKQMKFIEDAKLREGLNEFYRNSEVMRFLSEAATLPAQEINMSCEIRIPERETGNENAIGTLRFLTDSRISLEKESGDGRYFSEAERQWNKNDLDNYSLLYYVTGCLLRSADGQTSLEGTFLMESIFVNSFESRR